MQWPKVSHNKLPTYPSKGSCQNVVRNLKEKDQDKVELTLKLERTQFSQLMDETPSQVFAET